MSARILTLTGTPYPKAEIQSVDAVHGVATFRWLTSGGVAVDSGHSVARFTPTTPAGTPPVYPDPGDATLISAIQSPAVPAGPTEFDYTAFVAHCDARVPGFTARVLTAARSSTDVQNWVNVAVSRNAVHLDSPELAAAFAQFTAAGLMTADERTAILTP